MMTCSTFRRHLDEAEQAHEAAALPLALQEHLAECETCQLEWQVHGVMLRRLEGQEASLPSPLFTAQVMARLPVPPPLKWQNSFETILLIAAITAGLLAAWFVSDGLRESVLALVANGVLSETARAAVQRFLDATLWSWEETLVNTVGEQVLKQGLQVLLITLVTVIVAKGAVALDQRLRRMLKGF